MIMNRRIRFRTYGGVRGRGFNSPILLDTQDIGSQVIFHANSLRKGAFKTPAKEWMEHRLDKLHETLGGDTKMAALALKNLLGSIEMEPVPSECVVEGDRLIQSRAYYVAHSNIDTLTLLEEGKGSNSLHWRKR